MYLSLCAMHSLLPGYIFCFFVLIAHAASCLALRRDLDISRVCNMAHVTWPDLHEDQPRVLVVIILILIVSMAHVSRELEMVEQVHPDMAPNPHVERRPAAVVCDDPFARYVGTHGILDWFLYRDRACERYALEARWAFSTTSQLDVMVGVVSDGGSRESRHGLAFDTPQSRRSSNVALDAFVHATDDSLLR